jgi:capsular exopolysaccharide synthesis family protein
MNPDQPIKSLVISSCIPGEGKSTVALNLAQVAASIGKRVLLIDADLRLPQIHQTLELSNQYGLSNIISGEVSSEEAIQQSSLNNNLYVITSGATPPDPTRLLSSNSMKQLAQQWEDSFDLVLYDSPPLGGLADARLLTPLTNGLILVVGLGVTNRSIFKDVIDLLKVSQARVLGTVANGIKQGSVSDYYYHYTRYYSYYNNYTTDSHQASLASSNNNNRNQSS